MTPQDVMHKEFSAAARMRRGYDEAEVDAFLDEVTAELVRLAAVSVEAERLRSENADLRAQLAALHTRIGEQPL